MIGRRNRHEKPKTEVAINESKWQKLDDNILQKILKAVGQRDLLFRASLVCRWWRSVCWEVLFWKDHETLDLTNVRELIGFLRSHYAYSHWLRRALFSVMDPFGIEDRSNFVRNIVVPEFMCLNDDHIVIISALSPKLRRFYLPSATGISPSGLITSIQNWKELEEISFGPIGGSNRLEAVILMMGEKCKRLIELLIYGSLGWKIKVLDKSISMHISNRLPKLRVFSVKCIYFDQDAIRITLLEWESLREVNLIRCCREEGRPSKPIKVISARIIKCQTDDCVGWSLDSIDGLYTAEEVVYHLWNSLVSC